ncbi:MAG TPA: sensor histidine kinase [Burkholderiales bacterium]|nr:sensor histidine kinase [Burkholderiales bacterium]
MDQVSTLVSPQQLEKAFQLFDMASSELCLAYEDLRRQLRDLTQELAFAKAALQCRFDTPQSTRRVRADCEQVGVEDLLREAFESVEPQALARGVLLEIRDESAGCTLRADRPALVGALLGLLDNALQACAPGERICLAASTADAELALCVTDSGAGIAPEVRARLFEPFFTTRGEGFGLGLAMVRAVAEAHGGIVSVRSDSGAGSEFVLHLPLAPAAATQAPTVAHGVQMNLLPLADIGIRRDRWIPAL